LWEENCYWDSSGRLLFHAGIFLWLPEACVSILSLRHLCIEWEQKHVGQAPSVDKKSILFLKVNLLGEDEDYLAKVAKFLNIEKF
jgi:hypothetical protein